MLSLQSITPDIDTGSIICNEEQKDSINVNSIDSKILAESDVTFGFLERTKHQKLSTLQIEYLKNQICESGLTCKQLSNKFNVSPSQINKVKRIGLSQLCRGRSNSLIKIYGTEKNNLIKELQSFISNIDHALNSVEITNNVNCMLNKTYKPSYIRKIMKNELKLSFKKVKPRLNTIKFDVLKASRQLFAVKFTQLITKETLVINIDETSFNRRINNTYSWSRKGIPFEAKNYPFIGSINCIMSICSNGAWFLQLTNQTADLNKFKLFLDKLNEWIITNESFQKQEVLIVIDNCSIHKSKEVMQKLKQISNTITYLPAYTPQFAPIELRFSKIKENLRRSCSNKVVKLSEKSGYNDIYQALKNLKSKDIKLLFKEMYSIVNKFL